jgi:DNA-binding XRE family transcriptional regulator
MPAKPCNPVDVHVGARLRMRRIEINMSQQTLGEHLGLTFQQIQKYEKGTNRVGASRLQEIGKALEVPTAFFFEGAPGGWGGAVTGDPSTTHLFLDVLSTRDGQALVTSFGKIKDRALRRSIVDLVQRMAGPGGGEPPKARPSSSKRK